MADNQTSALRRALKKSFNLLGLLIAWTVIFTGFSLLLPGSFASFSNFETLMRQTVITGLGAIGMTYIIISGGIDISAGSVVALVTVVIALCLNTQMNPVFAALIGIATGALCGLINGTLVTQLKVGAFIVTLATLSAFRGIAQGLAHQQKVDAPYTWLTSFTASLSPAEKWQLLPKGAWLMVLCAAAASWGLRFTVFGRHVVAVGSNELAAKVSGVRVNRVKIAVYTLAGFFIGLAGLMQFSRLAVGDPTVATGLELDIIAAVVIGGGSLSGGEGSVVGSLIGALIITTIGAGAAQLGLPNWIQLIATGCIILIAVAIDRWRIARAALK